VETVIEAELNEFRDWTYRFRPAKGTPQRLLVLLHGWTGDENSMWVFARSFPEQVAVLAPRAPYPAPEGGYTWRVITPGTWGQPMVDDFRPSAEVLLGFVDDWSGSLGLDAHQFDLIGFSQGAALSYMITFLQPNRIRALAALSGFLPNGTDTLLTPQHLTGKPVFVAHGRQDEMISVEMARQSANVLKKSGALVTYCESDGGHKVSKECLGAMEKFFINLYN
jgi:phospholipase/carboxylesterase